MRGASLRPPLGVPMLLRLQATASSSSPHYICRQCITGSSVASRRGIQISAAPVTEFPKPSGGDAFGAPADGARDEAGESLGDGRANDDSQKTNFFADARFEVLGSPYSLLSVSLSASQNLYTRRGTLVSVAGKVENVGLYSLSHLGS